MKKNKKPRKSIISGVPKIDHPKESWKWFYYLYPKRDYTHPPLAQLSGYFRLAKIDKKEKYHFGPPVKIHLFDLDLIRIQPRDYERKTPNKYESYEHFKIIFDYREPMNLPLTNYEYYARRLENEKHLEVYIFVQQDKLNKKELEYWAGKVFEHQNYQNFPMQEVMDYSFRGTCTDKLYQDYDYYNLEREKTSVEIPTKN